jgi:hypothetical protein
MSQSINVFSNSMIRTVDAEAAKRHNDLRLPSGTRIGDCTHEQLAAELDRLGLEGFAHTMSRSAAIELYAAKVAEVSKAGADAAISNWLNEQGSK